MNVPRPLEQSEACGLGDFGMGLWAWTRCFNSRGDLLRLRAVPV